ncbi:COX15/CtaA family protein [Paenibacillus sp. HN-1]|uniref:COX15/CtaA family protein n=1 Tax=Paenibacillus TaxID=44249 RepID=UPI001CAA0AF1|nr:MULTISPECIES: COX15/CtaA family protein [Paenibacillus]MBY9078866.1 COX15/CtaA family protein [Paenibacillus sp. CGMCC 1.18879]MBY9082852.1 COX15/CtaA family protein [Paenibacillus sinensis]
MSGRQLRWLGYITCIVMFLTLAGVVLAMRTGSGIERGSEWPDYNGGMISAYTLEQIILWSYRLFSGLAVLAALASALSFGRYAKGRLDLILYACITLLFALIQAAMEASAVIWSQSAAVAMLHLGFTMMSFACSVMLAQGTGRNSAHDSAHDQLKDKRRLPRAFRNLVLMTAVLACLVMWLGVYVSRMDVRAAGSGIWPLHISAIITRLTGGTGVVLLHRLAVLALFGLVALLGHLAFWKHGADYPELKKLGIAAVLLAGLQVLSGAVLTIGGEQGYIFSAPAHAALSSGLVGVLCYMSVRVRQLGSPGAASRARIAGLAESSQRNSRLEQSTGQARAVIPPEQEK